MKKRTLDELMSYAKELEKQKIDCRHKITIDDFLNTPEVEAILLRLKNNDDSYYLRPDVLRKTFDKEFVVKHFNEFKNEKFKNALKEAWNI